jgi:hypothetical protein
MTENRRDYEEPRFEKREKLGDVTGLVMTSVSDGEPVPE